MLSALVVCAGTLPLHAQSGIGALEVVVRDAKNREPLPGARVGLSSAQLYLAPTAALTDGRGLVLFPVLHAGTGYVLEVSMPGYATQRLTELRVTTGSPTQQLILLSPELTERVQVVASSEVVELEKTTASTKFSDEFLASLPVPGRFYQNILSLTPGVKDADGDGNPNVHGARSRDFRAVVGGISNVDPLTGERLSFVNADSIEELEVITAGAGVEWGRAQGGFASIVQKQGGNVFEGSLGLLYQDARIDRAEGSDYQWLQPSLQVSGPIVRDKLWYRLSHEYVHREQPIDTLNGVGVQTRTQRIIAEQLTWQASARNKVSFQFQDDPLRIEHFDLSTRIPTASTKDFAHGGQTYSIQWTAPLSPRILTDTLVAYQDSGEEILPSTRGEPQNCLEFFFLSPFLPLQNSRCFDAGQNRVSGSYNESWRDKRQRLAVSSQATLYVPRLLGTSHRFKLGFAVENERYFRELERRPSVNFFVVRPPLAEPYGLGTFTVSVPDNSSGRSSAVDWSLYAEDQLKPRSNVTLTLGLRLDREEISSIGVEAFDPEAEARAFYTGLAALPDDRPAFVSALAIRTFTAYAGAGQFSQDLGDVLGVNPILLPAGPGAIQSQFWQKTRNLDDIVITNTNLSPRAALAWDPGNDGKTKLAATFGRYYDKIFLAIPLLELEPPTANLLIYGYDLTGSGTFRAFSPIGGISPAVNVSMVDRRLRTPHQDEWTLAFERALWPETSIKASYIRRKYRDQLQDVDVNHAAADHGRCLVASGLSSTLILPSPGTGLRIDPYTGREYQDTDPGPGDGRIDDCTGDIFQANVLSPQIPVPDGLPDLYVQNPGWGELLLVGNSNTADYEAFVLELVRRHYRNWELDASYTWSKAVGDAEDFNQALGNERTLHDDERGLLEYDQRHVAQLNASVFTVGNFRIGTTVRWESGRPYSLLASKLTIFAVPPEYQNLGDRAVRFRLRYPTGQRNDQRNTSFWTANLRVAREFALRRASLALSLEVFNLFNDTTLIVDDQTNGSLSGERRVGRQFQLGLKVGF
ncbi:MAG TPA: TonB-dependent receptor [Candidatus Polarisedimenticolaceae bacterium]|nr:TonB-dependent receptor [Candidatus Polarisedimenticolaceae bacterium]